ncbi:MAG: SOS response-associated peptidase family protein [Spirochaetota bacterium]|nr:SOS response-associated peptidase family protein [Spirochaetota bacterium]
MCGRFTLKSPIDDIVKDFNIKEIEAHYIPRYNVAPGENIFAVIKDSVNKLIQLKWGLIPYWSKDPSIGYKMINARAETISQKPSFKQPFKNKRCLIIADGFYEWRKEGKYKHPMYIQLKSKSMFAFAGLWDTWKSPDGNAISTCTIITTDSNDIIKPIHNRMPVILAKESEALWLDNDIKDEQMLKSCLVPYDSDKINAIHGSGTIRCLQSGINHKWKMRQNNLSNRYTTRWDELITVML